MGDSRRESVERVPVPPVNLESFVKSQSQLGYGHRFRHPMANIILIARLESDLHDNPAEFFRSTRYAELKERAHSLTQAYREFMLAMPEKGHLYEEALAHIDILLQGKYELNEPIYANTNCAVSDWEDSRFGPSKIPKNQLNRDVA